MNNKTPQNNYKHESGFTNYEFKPSNTSYAIAIPIFIAYLILFIAIVYTFYPLFFISLISKSVYKYMPYIFENISPIITQSSKIIGYPAYLLTTILLNTLWPFNKTKWFKGV